MLSDTRPLLKGSKSTQVLRRTSSTGACVYFEKLRINQGAKKSKKREEMERIWGRTNVSSTQTDCLFLFKDERAVYSQYRLVGDQ